MARYSGVIGLHFAIACKAFWIMVKCGARIAWVNALDIADFLASLEVLHWFGAGLDDIHWIFS